VVFRFPPGEPPSPGAPFELTSIPAFPLSSSVCGPTNRACFRAPLPNKSQACSGGHNILPTFSRSSVFPLDFCRSKIRQERSPGLRFCGSQFNGTLWSSIDFFPLDRKFRLCGGSPSECNKVPLAAHFLSRLFPLSFFSRLFFLSSAQLIVRLMGCPDSSPFSSQRFSSHATLSWMPPSVRALLLPVYSGSSKCGQYQVSFLTTVTGIGPPPFSRSGLPPLSLGYQSLQFWTKLPSTLASHWFLAQRKVFFNPCHGQLSV